LIESNFEDCNLLHAKFDQTNLEKANFETANYFSIDPRKNRIKKAKFSKDNLEGLLDSFEIQIN
jgi:uncharacterized protein YjbI with pentapeptide repeats